MDDAESVIDMVVDLSPHAVHGGWEVRNGVILCTWDGEVIARAPSRDQAEQFRRPVHHRLLGGRP